MNKRDFLTLALGLPALTACASSAKPRTDRDLRGWGFVVYHELAPGAQDKYGVEGTTDTGFSILGNARLSARNSAVSAYGGSRYQSFPKWVRVTWREGITAYLRGKSGHYETGTVVGDHTVPVLERIPEELFTYVRAQRGRAIRLKFRIHDEGVLFGWDVEDHGKDFKGPLRNVMAGGDW